MTQEANSPITEVFVAGMRQPQFPGDLHACGPRRQSGSQARVPKLHGTFHDLGVLWQDLPGFDRLQRALALTEKAAFTAEGLLKWANRIRPAGEPELTEVPLTDRRRVAKIPELIAKLDDDSFQARERAAKELEELGELAGPALRKELEGNPSPEVRRQVTRILQQLQFPGSSPELLRAFRAIEVLEQIANPEAKAVLETLASGSAKDPAASEAKVSLKRMTK